MIKLLTLQVRRTCKYDRRHDPFVTPTDIVETTLMQPRAQTAVLSMQGMAVLADVQPRIRSKTTPIHDDTVVYVSDLDIIMSRLLIIEKSKSE